ncbi:MAG: Gldg family protein [Verrucomicrobia bacterium]|nr:Gldg family protein [Verrucomicrobiota bacterium]
MPQPRGPRLFGSSLAAFAVVAVIVAAVNILLGGVVWRIDMTQDRIYTLSDGTRDVLKGLDGPVTFKLFFNGSDPQVPPTVKLFARSVEDLLREYEIAGKGNILVEVHDPQPDSDAADWARRYGVESQPVGMFGPDLALGLVAVKGGAEAVLPFLNPDEQERLEYDITRLVTRVANPKKPVLGLLASLPVMGAGAPQMPFGPPQRQQKGWYAFTDLEKDYEIRQLAETIEAVDADIDALVVVHPKGLPEAALFAIDQFVLRGGRLLAFVDPMCLADEQAPNPMGMPNFGGGGSTLGPLFTAWGVGYEPERAIADLEAITPTRGRDNRVVNNPTWLSLRPANMNAEDRLTARVETILLPGAGIFKVEPPAGVQSTVLMWTSDASGLVDAMTAKMNPEGLQREFKSGMRREALAVRLSGKFKTAFPDGKPGAAAPTNAPGAGVTNTPPAPSSLKEGNGEGRVVLVGDVDMLFDPFCLREVRMMGQTAYAPWNDNLTFFYSVLEDISGSAKLSQIRSRGRLERPFDVVAGLLREAQERYMEAETALQSKLEQTQQRLTELQAEKGQGQEMVLSAEQKAEVERFRKQELETRQALKEVRKSLRADIERLGAVVKAVNILGVPLLVGIAGIGFGLWRRNRR